MFHFRRKNVLKEVTYYPPPPPNSFVVQKFRLSIYHVAKWKCSASRWYTQCISFYWLCMHSQAHSNPITITYVHWKISSYNFHLQFWKKHPTSISRSEKVLHRTFIWERRSGLLYTKINSKKKKIPPNLWNFKDKFENEHLLCLFGLMASQEPKIGFLGGLNSVCFHSTWMF